MFFEVECQRVDAETLTSGIWWTIWEYMAEMAAAVRTGDFITNHEMRYIFMNDDGFGNRSVKAWPATAGVILRR